MTIFKLSGNTSKLNIILEHPLHLDEDVQYKIALIGFYSENNFYNLLQSSLMYFENIKTPLVIDSGYWTIESLQKHVRDFLTNSKVDSKEDSTKSLKIDSTKFEILKENNRLLIKSPLRFHMDNTIRSLLGFNSVAESVLQDNYKAENAPNLRFVDVVEIHSNIVDNGYTNHTEHYHRHDETSILYQFYPKVPHGYKISETPQYPHYVLLRKGLNTIKEINIELLNQNGLLLQNPDSNNYIYIDLIRV